MAEHKRNVDPVHSARGRIARAVRVGDTEGEYAARQALSAAHIERAIQQAAESAPPLTDEQRSRLAGILLAGLGQNDA